GGEQLQVEPAQGAERHDLEHRVDRHQYRGGLPVPARQVVPDEHHRDAPGESHDDQPGTKLGRSGKKIHANANMNAGPRIQFKISDSVRSLRSPVTLWVSS